MLRSLLFTIPTLALIGFTACSDDDPATPPPAVSPDATPEPMIPPTETIPDASSEDTSSPTVAIEGSLTVTPLGASTMPAGSFTPKTGSAQWRPRPAGGGVLTVGVAEESGRAIELTLYDDADSLAADESFNADAPGSIGLHKARVETFKDTTAWRSRGDGKAIVKAFDASSVTIELQTFGQEATADIFTLAGTIKVPLSMLGAQTGSAATLAVSNVLPEPITSEANNMAGSSQAIAGTTSLDERTIPFSGTRRALEISDSAGGTKRTVRVDGTLTFPIP